MKRFIREINQKPNSYNISSVTEGKFKKYLVKLLGAKDQIKWKISSSPVIKKKKNIKKKK
jgi:hypothetical protein